MPKAIGAAIRVGLASGGLMVAIRQNMATPTATSTLVRRPAIFWRHCRSPFPLPGPQHAVSSVQMLSYAITSQAQRAIALVIAR